MAITNEKVGTVHGDYITSDNPVSDNSSFDDKNLDEVAIHDLETTGEVVGMTFRTIMAFLVSVIGFTIYHLS
jgi:hypothetical protein